MIKRAIKRRLISVRLITSGSLRKVKKFKQWVLTSKTLLCTDCTCMITHAFRSDVFAVAARNRGGGAFWNVGWGGGDSSSTQPYVRPFSNFSKCPLRCSLAQAMFTVSSVSVKDLWQCNMRAENTRSEVTGIVKSFLKVSFGTKTWGTRPPPPLHPPLLLCCLLLRLQFYRGDCNRSKDSRRRRNTNRVRDLDDLVWKTGL